MTESTTEVPTGEFRLRLTEGLLAAPLSPPGPNTDWLRYPAKPWKRFRRDLRARWRKTLGKLGYVRRRGDVTTPYLAFVMDHLADLERTYDRLADETSKAIYLDVLRYRALGPKHVALPSNTPEYWRHVHAIERDHRVGDGEGSAGDVLGALGRYRIDGREGPITADLHALNVLNTFRLEHYACRHGGPPIEVREGDVVVDGGGCWGDTALYFADRVGPKGRVACFEFVPDNLRILRANLARNPHLADRVDVVEHAMWNASDEELHFDLGAGAGTTVGADSGGDASVTTLTIDDLVERRGLERVDWIKLDIEGAERAALEGARETLQRFRPRLAISVYHKLEDLYDLPDLIAEILPEHEQRLTHVTIHAEETVVFAAPAQ